MVTYDRYYDITADALLRETVAYSLKMLRYLSDATVHPDYKGYKGLYHLAIQFSTDTDAFMHDLFRRSGATVIEEEPDSVSHPHIISAFRKVLVKLMSANDFVHQQDCKFPDFTPNVFNYGGSYSTLSISALSLTFSAAAEGIEKVWNAVDEATLEKYCSDALEEIIIDVNQGLARSTAQNYRLN